MHPPSLIRAIEMKICGIYTPPSAVAGSDLLIAGVLKLHRQRECVGLSGVLEPDVDRYRFETRLGH
jgi:hypothetical protein